MANLKQVTTRNRAFLVVQTADHITGLAGATPVINVSKNGSTPLHTAGATITELGKGWYNAALTTSDTNTVGDLVFHVDTASGDPTDWLDEVSANILGDTLPGNVLQWNGSNVATPLLSGVPIVDLGDIAGQALSTAIAQLGVRTVSNADKTGYTASTVSDKTGYSLSQSFPANFSSLGINAAGALSQSVTSGTVLDKTGYSFAQAFPSNFSSLAITAGGAVTVGTNSDKTGYSLSQAFPSNFSSQLISAGGLVSINSSASVLVTAPVTVGTNNDKTGYSLAGTVTTGSLVGTALDSILNRQLTESYAALHAVPSFAQAILELRAHHSEKSISATSVTIFQIDGATAAEVFSLNNTSPTSISRNA